MSGGVDSSVAAWLLKEQGYDVIGVTMQIWQDDKESETDSCCGISAVGDAKRVAARIGIPHYVMNFRDEFKEKVDKIAELAVGDACTGSNPRSINPEQMAKLLTCCFYDTEVDF